MRSRLHLRKSAPSLLLLSALALAGNARAAEPGSYWSGGLLGEPYTAYKAGLNFDDDRRPLDGSLRTPRSASTWTWTGLYVGGHLGGGIGEVETSRLGDAAFDINTFLGGVHGGYNAQVGDIVLGAEVDGTWTSSSSNDTTIGGLAIDAKNDWLSSARLRLGYATDQFMVYATAGVAIGDLDVTISQPGFSQSFSDTMVGYALGGGVEMKLTDNWIARVEALHYEFDEEDFKTSLGALDVDSDVTSVRVGLTWRFN